MSKLEFVRDENKNQTLKANKSRGGYGFEDIVDALEAGNKSKFVGSQSKKYKSQLNLLIEIDGYVYCVPCAVKGEKIRLITIFPSRRWTKLF